MSPEVTPKTSPAVSTEEAASPVSSHSHDDKRQRILAVAYERLVHYGVNKTTMSDIAEDAGTAVGTLYLYFKNKDEIVLAIARECQEKMAAEVQAILSDETQSAEARLKAMLQHKLRHRQQVQTRTPHEKELIAYFFQHYPEQIAACRQRAEADLTGILQVGIKRGEFVMDDSSHAAHVLQIALSGFFFPPHLEIPSPLEESDLLALLNWFISQWTPPEQ